MPPGNPTSGTQTIHPNNEVTNTPQLEYSEAAQNHILFRRRRMVSARDQRDGVRDEFDGMTFLDWYAKMKRADDQFVPPRRSRADISIETGTIRDKDSSLLEYAMKYDFEPIAQVYDDDDEVLEELAETGEDLVRKSKQLEQYRDKAKLIYRSMIAFGTANVEEAWVERWGIEKQYGKNMRVGDLKATWTEKKVKQYDGCQAKLWDLRKCYYGDITKFFMNGPQGQPYFFTAEYVSYDIAKQWFGDWDRFKYVPMVVVPTPELSSAVTWTSSWTLRPITTNFVEIVRYYDPIMNEYALTLNGIDMLPIQERQGTENGLPKTFVSGFPLQAISPSGAIPFAKFDLEPMHDFAYSKAQPAKMRIWADVENMMVKTFVRMFKQKATPTMGNKSGRLFGPEIFAEGEIINDIRDGDLFPIIPNFQGATPADFSFYELTKKELDKNSVERSFQGTDAQPQDDTATKTISDLKAQSLKVAALFDGIISGENQLAWLRTYNIAKNWTKPIDVQIDTFKAAIENKYRTVNVATEVDGGQKANKRIVFTKDTGSKDTQDVHQEEMDHQKKTGKELRIAYLHPEQFASMKLNWYYSTIPVPNDSDPFSYMMFAKQINDAMTFFGPDSINVKRLKHRFASITGNDFDTWFVAEQELEQKRAQAAAAVAPTAPGAPTTPGQPTPPPTMGNVATGAMPNMAGMMK